MAHTPKNLIAHVRAAAPEPGDMEAVHGAIESFFGDDVRAGSCSVISAARKMLAGADDPLAQHFACPAVRARVDAIAVARKRADAQTERYAIPADDLVSIKQWAVDVVSGRRPMESRDMAACAIQLLTGARFVEVVTAGFDFALQGDKIRHRYALKNTGFDLESRGSAVKHRVSSPLADAETIIMAWENLRAELAGGYFSERERENAQARVKTLIKGRRGNPGKYPLLAKHMDGYYATHGKKRLTYFFRHLYVCLKELEAERQLTEAEVAVLLGHEELVPPPARAYMGLAPGGTEDSGEETEGPEEEEEEEEAGTKRAASMLEQLEEARDAKRVCVRDERETVERLQQQLATHQARLAAQEGHVVRLEQQMQSLELALAAAREALAAAME